MNLKRPQLLITGIALLIVADALIVRFSYKENWLAKYGTLILAAIAIALICFSLFSDHYTRDKTETTVGQKLFSALITFVFIIGWICDIGLSWHWADQRKAEILSGPTLAAYAHVIHFEDTHNGKYGDTHEIIIEYRNGTETITRSLVDQPRRYAIGDSISIRYSIDYPDMFVVTQP